MEASRKTKSVRRIKPEESFGFNVTVEQIVTRIVPSNDSEHNLNPVQAAFVAIADQGQTGQYKFTVPSPVMGWDDDVTFSLYVEVEPNAQ